MSCLAAGGDYLGDSGIEAIYFLLNGGSAIPLWEGCLTPHPHSQSRGTPGLVGRPSLPSPVQVVLWALRTSFPPSPLLYIL